MNNLERILEIIFRRVSVQSVLRGNVSSDNFRQDEFVKIAFVYMKQYSESELSNMWLFYKDVFTSERRQYSFYQYPMYDGFSVFDALFYFTNRILVVQNNEILCIYNELQKWRKLTLQLSEDLLVCAYCAGTMTPETMRSLGFGWNSVIGHNNMQLNDILKKGISENHFHLYGSIPVFHISWISLMNRVLDSDVASKLRNYDQTKRNANIQYSAEYEENSLMIQHFQAALIRLVLFEKILGGDKKQKLFKEEIGNYSINELLLEQYKLEMYVTELQSRIVVLQNTISGDTKKELVDYALLGVQGSFNDSKDIFAGERWLLYSCLYKIYKDEFNEEEKNLFYMYIILRENIRAELVQVNNQVGFENFQKYQRRKNELIYAPIFNREAIRKTVSDTLLEKHLKYLELRITPGKTVNENLKLIHRLDEIIGEPMKKYFYVFHFIKAKDEKDYKNEYTQCRHYILRNKLEKISNGIIHLRERYPECANRIKGIDAAGNEIGCRPEVFASTFRYLKSHIKVKEDVEKRQYISQLKVTYHVGEDFLDIADGLRAIDEAVNFLNLDCGDRLGHAIALGIDVKDWYRSKNYCILIPQQDYLDNLVWVYNRLIQFKIKGMDFLKDYIRKKYEQYFHDIYGKFMDYGVIRKILKNAEKINGKMGIQTIFKNDRCYFDIGQYYDAWKLRGDDPNLYSHGYFQWYNDGTMKTKARVNQKFPKQFEIRYNPEVFLLNYYYHFDNDVRKAGNKRIAVQVREEYITAVSLIQKEMPKCIGRRGISIEANPTSNFLIGTFKDYAKHPIFRFYNKNLTYDKEKLEDCPQLSVSINTDDQGVFVTSLENEYALLASALENVKNKEGEYVYNKNGIYAWIDDVRKMGNAQSFANTPQTEDDDVILYVGGINE